MTKARRKPAPQGATRSRAFRDAMNEAKEYAADPERLKSLIDEAVKKARRMPKGPFKESWAYFLAMLRLLRAYYAGSYRKIPWHTVLLIIAAVIYVVNPMDFIPDMLLGVGLLDDATVLAFALRAVKDRLDAFMDWETTRE
jgi:uncharacterized membrane protein YkvA (DUF1232 family)